MINHHTKWVDPHSSKSAPEKPARSVYDDLDRRAAALMAAGLDEDTAFERAADHCELVEDYFEGDALAWA